MAEFCTCGAELVADARFCHKCGRPLFELPRAEEAVVEVVPSAPAAPLPLNFHNPIAVRVGLLMASLAGLLCWMPFLNLLGVIWLFTAGFSSVYVYQRRTGQMLSIRGGARLGWITGVFSFVIITLLFTISILALTSARGGLAAIYQEQIRTMPRDANVEEALKLLQSPGGVAIVIVLTLLIFFALIISLCTAGGALGAKIASKDS